MYSDTVTLFNRVQSVGGDVFRATELEGVDFNADKGAIMSRYGAETDDNAILHVRYENADGEALIGGKTYLEPKEFQRSPGGAITFTGGQSFDFFILGEWDGDDEIADDDYTAGFYDYCNKYYDHCYAITSAAKYSVIPHFEVTGR